MGTVVACIAGAALGLRLGVLVLVPITVIACLTFMAINGLCGRGIFADFGYLATLIAAFQAGYFVGLTGRDFSTGLLQRFQSQTKRV